jgi:hypothetical protein
MKIKFFIACILLLSACAPAPKLVEVTRIVPQVQTVIVIPPTLAPIPTATIAYVEDTATPTVAEEKVFSNFEVKLNKGAGNRGSCQDISWEFAFTITAVRPITAILIMVQADGVTIKKTHGFTGYGETWEYSRSLKVRPGHWVIAIRLWGYEQITDADGTMRDVNYGPLYGNQSGTFDCR